MALEFRLFQNKDRIEFEKMVYGLYAEDPEGEAMSQDKIRATVEHLASNPNKGRIYIFNQNGKVLGYGIIIFHWSNEYGGDIVAIDELYVKEEWRNRGIGTSFMRYLLKLDKEIRGLKLEVTPTNQKALRLYEGLGFKKSTNTHMMWVD